MVPLTNLNWVVKDTRAMERNSSLIQPECGMSNFKLEPTAALEEISGGECTNEHAFPWIVRLDAK